jgi:hypothetical protein
LRGPRSRSPIRKNVILSKRTEFAAPQLRGDRMQAARRRTCISPFGATRHFPPAPNRGIRLERGGEVPGQEFGDPVDRMFSDARHAARRHREGVSVARTPIPFPDQEECHPERACRICCACSCAQQEFRRRAEGPAFPPSTAGIQPRMNAAIGPRRHREGVTVAWTPIPVPRSRRMSS